MADQKIPENLPNGRTAGDRDQQPQAVKTPEAKQEKIEARRKTIRSKGATVTFNVTVPEETGRSQSDVYLAGSLSDFSPNLPDWDPRGLKMQKIDDRRWTVTLMGSANVLVEYKYTLGDWHHTEKNAGCDDIPNRRLLTQNTSSRPQTVQDTVEGWQNVAPCDVAG